MIKKILIIGVVLLTLIVSATSALGAVNAKLSNAGVTVDSANWQNCGPACASEAWDNDQTGSDAYDSSWYYNGGSGFFNTNDAVATLDLGAAYCISVVEVVAPANGGATDEDRATKDMRLEYSLDESTWLNYTGNSGTFANPTGTNDHNNVTLTPNNMRWVRYVHENGYLAQLGITEVFFYYDSTGADCAPAVTAPNKTINYYYPASNFETNPSKIEVDLVQYNVTNNTIAQLIYGNQTINAVANVTNQTNARFWANVTSYLIPSQVSQPFYFLFTLNHTNGSINPGYNSSNVSQTLNVGCFVNDVVLGSNNLLGENNTYSSKVNVSTLGLCRLHNLSYQYDGIFYSQPVPSLATTGQTATNHFNFDVSIPHTYFNLSLHKVNITAEFKYRTSKNHNLSATSSVIWNLTKHPRFNISVYDLINNQPLLNFTAFNGKAIGTTNGSVFWWEYGTGIHEIGVNNTGYELLMKNLTFTAGTFQHQTYYLYTTNSFNFSLRDERTDQLVPQNTTLEFIGDAKSYNYTIQNGKLYVDLLVPSNYTIRYQTNPAIGKTATYHDYGLKRSYLVKLTAQSHQDITLYLLDNGNSTTTKVTVYDQNSLTGVEGAAVYVERYFLQGNAYKTVAMCSTGVAGECNFDLEHNEELYKFKVEYPWLTPKTSTVPSYISSTTLNLYIDLFKKAGENFFLQEGIAGSIAYSSSTPTFTATYTDAENSASKVCLKLKTYGQYSKQTINESCSTAASGTLVVTGFAAQKNNYGVLTATVGGQEKVIKAVWKDLNTDKLQAGASGVFLSAIMFIILSLLSVVHVYAAILGSVGLIFAYMMGMLAIDLSYLILILGSSIILAIIIQMKR